MPSTKSIHAYFVKTTTTSAAITTAMTAQKAVIPRRESLTGSGAVAKKSVLEKSLVSGSAQVAEKLSSTVESRVLQEQSLTTENTSEAVVVEAKSRFFGFETHASSEVEACPNSQSRSAAAREDSGVGLDEESLLHTPNMHCGVSEDDRLSREIKKTKLLPSKSLSNFRTPRTDAASVDSADDTKSSQEDNKDLSKAEAKVIQGWREKFSNPSGSMAVRTPGLKRAFQGSSSMTKSAYVSSSQPARQITTKPTKMLRPSVAQSAGLILTTPGHPTHHLDTVRRAGSTVNRSGSRATVDKPSLFSPGRTMDETLAQGESDDLSQATENKGAPNSTLNLDRFKYTRVSTPLGASAAELGP
ncbi:hypothetical protein EDD21DRAFT_377600 [Dissophora ornata]|nr:hypothetical protein EDD21DRAFT_377600 [Dissophora ornata]